MLFKQKENFNCHGPRHLLIQTLEANRKYRRDTFLFTLKIRSTEKTNQREMSSDNVCCRQPIRFKVKMFSALTSVEMSRIRMLSASPFTGRN